MTRDQAIGHLTRGMCGRHVVAEKGCATCERTVEALATLERLAWERGVDACRDVLARSDSLNAAVDAIAEVRP